MISLLSRASSLVFATTSFLNFVFVDLGDFFEVAMGAEVHDFSYK